MVIQSCNWLFKVSLEKKLQNKRKKDGLKGFFLSVFDYFLYLVSMKTHSVLFWIFDIFNNYALKSGQKNTGEAVLSRSPSYN